MKNVQELQQETEKKTGLCIIRIETEKELGLYLDRGLASLYRDVFGGEPYNEIFTDAEVRGIFNEFLEKQGKIFVALDGADGNRPVAFVTSVPLRSEFNVVAAAGIPEKFVEKAGYFAEDGVAEKFRRRGVSGSLKKLLIEANFAEGADNVILRTSVRNYCQISAVSKAGGIVFKERFQNVARNLKDGTTAIDRNGFFWFGYAPADVEKLDNVRVLRLKNGRDVAVVNGACFGADGRKNCERRIIETYAGIEQVCFDGEGPEGKEVFSGRLYFASPPRMLCR